MDRDFIRQRAQDGTSRRPVVTYVQRKKQKHREREKLLSDKRRIMFPFMLIRADEQRKNDTKKKNQVFVKSLIYGVMSNTLIIYVSMVLLSIQEAEGASSLRR